MDAEADVSLPTAATQRGSLIAWALQRAPGVATFARHQVSSVISTVVDFGTMTLAVELVRLSPVTATLAGASAGALVNFQLGRRWIFDATEHAAAPQALRYAVVSAASALLNGLGEYVVHCLGHVEYVAARAIVALLVSVAWNFPMQRRFVFGTRVAS